MQYLSNDELVRLCQRTLPYDTSAFEELVARHKQRVFSIAYRIMGNVQDAEDQSQEVFLKVYRNIHTLDDPQGLVAWLVRVTTNTCLDAISRRQRRPQTVPFERPQPDSGIEEEVVYADQRMLTPEEEALRTEVWQCLEETLSQMDTDARTALVLRDIEDRPYQEIAEMLSLGLSAVKMRIHRARQLFQRLLDMICPGVSRYQSWN